MAPRLFVYKMVYDGGGAPSVDEDLLTLAICKPVIRASAGIGDLLFGFAANSLSPDNRLIYIARVTGVEENYYDDPAFSERPDCIYIRGEDGRFRVRSDARFHEDGSLLDNDIGHFPEYDRARVLVSDDYRHFGSTEEPPRIDLDAYPAVRARVAGLKQGHRVNHPPSVERELWQLQRAAWGQDFADGRAPQRRLTPERDSRGDPGRGCR